MHVYPIWNLSLFSNQLQMRFLTAKADHVSVSAAAVRFIGTAQIDRFQNVCFSLRIISVKNINTSAELDGLQAIIPEIRQAQGLYYHITPFTALIYFLISMVSP